MQKELVRQRAFPTIGIILLGGLTDDVKRFPRHTSAGIAYTSLDHDVYTETSIVESDVRIGMLDNNPVNDSYRSPFRILEKYQSLLMKHLSSDKNSLGFISRNSNILSGSSDSGAAALGSAIMELSGNSIDPFQLENDLRTISESAGRSLHGGLTITEVHEGFPGTTQLLPDKKFESVVIVGCRFNEKRKPSDTIHTNIVKSPKYPERIRSTETKAEILKKLSEMEDVEGIFELAQNDTDEYHRLIESVGVNIINGDMRRFIGAVRDLQRKFWCTYIVTGGTNVFVAVHPENADTVADEARKFSSDPVKLKVAGAPVNLFSVS